MVNRFRDSFHWKTFFFPHSLQCWLETQWPSHQHERACYTPSLTRAPAFILSALPFPSLTLCFLLSGLALHNRLGREVRKCRQEKKKKKRGLPFSRSHFSLSRSHLCPLLTLLLPGALLQSVGCPDPV